MNQHVDKSENLKLNRRRIFCTDAPQQLKYQNIKQLLCFALLFNTIYDNYDQGPTGSRYPTRPEFFFKYPTRPDPKIENDWVPGN